MIRFHLDQVTHGYFADHDAIPEDLSCLDGCCRTVRAMAEATGDLRWLQLGLQQLVNDPLEDLVRFAGPFPLHADDVRAIIWRLLAVLDAPGGIAAPVLPIELVDMTADEWQACRAGPAPR